MVCGNNLAGLIRERRHRSLIAYRYRPIAILAGKKLPYHSNLDFSASAMIETRMQPARGGCVYRGRALSHHIPHSGSQNCKQFGGF
jgi:hypothetical protein